MRTGRIGLIVAAIVVALDQLSKWWAVRSLADGRIVDVAWTLRMKLGYNSGFAFGTGQRFGVVVGVVAAIVVAFVVRAMLRASSTFVALALALIAGGATGNIVDRVFRHGGLMRGQVVDFVDLQWWPVFNLADSAITVGAVLLVIGSVVEWRTLARGTTPGTGAR